jgi:hypothetical protein
LGRPRRPVGFERLSRLRLPESVSDHGAANPQIAPVSSDRRAQRGSRFISDQRTKLDGYSFPVSSRQIPELAIPALVNRGGLITLAWKSGSVVGAVGGRPQHPGSAATTVAEPGNRVDSTSSTLGRSPSSHRGCETMASPRYCQPQCAAISTRANGGRRRWTRAIRTGRQADRVHERSETAIGLAIGPASAKGTKISEWSRFSNLTAVGIDSVSAETLVRVRAGCAGAPTPREWWRCRSRSHPPWHIPICGSGMACCRTSGRGADGRSLQDQ